MSTARVLTAIFFSGLLFFSPKMGHSATYYVSPTGNDTNAGTSLQAPWQSLAKVNEFKFTPGDIILFQRGGEWHESLKASMSGTVPAPITYDAYGEGPKPHFWGSDLLINKQFEPAGDKKYSYKLATQADAALINHVFVTCSWNGGVLTITSDTDPRTDGKVYTACVRGNSIFSNAKNHLVFKNLIVDETAGQLNKGEVQGYGVRIEGSTNVTMEDCEANRCGRHNFGVINTTGFVGRRLNAEFAHPNTPGGNTFYVSYADGGAPNPQCTSQYIDCTASHLEDGKGGQYPFFVSHGEKLGEILFQNVKANGKISVMSAPCRVVGGTLYGNGSFENFGAKVLIDGLTLKDSAAIDQYGSDGIIQNCIVNLTPTGGGPTGYGSAIVFRDKAARNTVRFNTFVSGSFSPLAITWKNSATNWYGNIVAGKRSINFTAGAPTASDLAFADFNFYAADTDFGGKNIEAWKSQGFDKNALSGDPQFENAGAGNFALKATSNAKDAGKVTAEQKPEKDFAGTPRPLPCSLGALQGK